MKIGPFEVVWLNRVRDDHARKLGFNDRHELDLAEYMASLARDNDETATVAFRYIERDRARRAAARAAAGAPRRGKWSALRDEALTVADEIRAARPGLSRSRLTDLVMDRLAGDHDKLPGRSTLMGWLKKVYS